MALIKVTKFSFGVDLNIHVVIGHLGYVNQPEIFGITCLA